MKIKSLESLSYWYFGRKGLNRRYCGSRLSLGMFLAIHLSLLLIISVGLSTLILYTVIIPNTIRDTFSGKGSSQSQSSGDSIVIRTLNITETTNSYYIEAYVPSFLAMGGSFDLKETNWYLADDSKELAEFNTPAISLKLSEPTKLSFSGKFLVQDMPRLSNSIATGKLSLKTRWSFTVFSIFSYSNLELQRDFFEPASTTTQQTPSNPLPKAISAPDLNMDISKMIPESSLMSLGPSLPKISVQNLSIVEMTGSNVAILSDFYLENPVTIQANFTKISFTLAGLNQPIADISFTPSSGIWPLSNMPNPRSKVMKVTFLIQIRLKRPGSSFMTAFLGVIGDLQESASLQGPFDFVVEQDAKGKQENTGHLLGEMTSKMKIDLSQDLVSEAISGLLLMLQ